MTTFFLGVLVSPAGVFELSLLSEVLLEADNLDVRGAANDGTLTLGSKKSCE